MAQHETAAATGEKLSASEKKRFQTLENRIEKGLKAQAEMGEALLAIREERLYRETHATWEAYCRDRWGFADSRARQLIRAARVKSILVRAGTSVPVNEAQARELAPLVKDPEKLVAVAERVLLPETQVSAADIRAEVRKVRLSSDAADPGEVLLDDFRHQASVGTNQIKAGMADIVNAVRAVHHLHPGDFEGFIREVTKRLRATGVPDLADDDWWGPLVGLDADLRVKAVETDRAARSSRRKTASAA